MLNNHQIPLGASDSSWSLPIDLTGAAEGIKYDAGKLPYELLPLDAIESVVKVLRFGADKYGSRNWERGMGWGRLFGAATRHLTAWFRGYGLDEETGLSHLSHAACCILFLLAYEQRKIGTDDRSKY